MTDQEVSLFEAGFRAYADGLPREFPALSNCWQPWIKWWLKGWDASKEANELLRQQFETGQ